MGASEIAENWRKVREQVPRAVEVVAVSKTKPMEAVVSAYGAGARSFGENRVQELVGKHEALTAEPSPRASEFRDLRWHQIGTLQKNKVKYIAPFVGLIHAVDQEALLEEINKRAAKHQRKIAVLLQLHIAQEASKFGLSADGLSSILERLTAGQWPHVEVKGLMGMATFTSDTAQVGREFRTLRRLYDRHAAEHHWDTLSMGMSGDWRIAVEEGSTMVRIGSAIFGAR